MEPWRYGRRTPPPGGWSRSGTRRSWRCWSASPPWEGRVLGICRGHQVINVFFGGTLVQDLPGHGAAGDIDRLHFVRTAASPLRELYGERHVVNSAHHQAVDRLGSGLRALQWAPDGTVEALCHRTLPVWGVQWHPERTGGYLDGVRLFRWFLSLCRA